MTKSARPEISVIVPVLNEAPVVPSLLDQLARQQDVALEVILCDGGSTDGTAEAALGTKVPFPVVIAESERGRGRQLDSGVAAATAGFFLFLHADSTFPDPRALRAAVDFLCQRNGGECAGKFRLRFRRSASTDQGAYYFYESKACLLRPECSHGDQGMLLSRELFDRLGPFDRTHPMLAETRLADRALAEESLVLLPATIETSARRFETEGLRERQTLNAIIMNFAAQQWDTFFDRLPELYRSHDESDHLPLSRLIGQVLDLMADLPSGERRRRWQATGAYVRDNAWQLAFALDALRNFREGRPPGSGPTPILDRYDRRIDRLTDHGAGRLAATLLVWLWAQVARRKKMQQ